MKNLINKVLVLLLVLFVGISLVACEEDNNYNTNVSYGSLGNTTYATLGDIKLTEKELYDELRSNGYDYFFDALIEKLVNPTNQKVTLQTEGVADEIEKLILEDCYNTSDWDEINKFNAASKKAAEDKYIDTMKLAGITDLTNDNLISKQNQEHYLKEVAQRVYAKNQLIDKNGKYSLSNFF